MRVALFITCINDGLYPETGKAVVEVIERLGHEVVFPTEQTCCGQMHFNAGYQAEGLQLAHHFRDVFGSYDVIVSPSASCVGTVRELYATAARAADDTSLASDLDGLTQRVFEFSEFLTDVAKVTDVGASFRRRVAYHPTCHSLRVLGITNGPRLLLERVEGLELVDFIDLDQCCGFGGMFSLKNSETSIAMGQDKFGHIADASAEVVCSLDNSCLTHIGGIAARASSPIKAMHLAEILASRDGG